MIRRITSVQAGEIALLHQRYLSSPLQVLPIGFLKNFYLQVLSDPSNFCFGYHGDQALTGFVVGTFSVNDFFQKAFKSRPWYFYGRIIRQSILNPKFGLKVLSGIRQADRFETENHLVYLMVHPAHQNVGIAGELLRALNEHMVANGVDAYELMVEEQNLPAIQFYEKHQFQLIKKAGQKGPNVRRYRYNLQ